MNKKEDRPTAAKKLVNVKASDISAAKKAAAKSATTTAKPKTATKPKTEKVSQPVVEAAVVNEVASPAIAPKAVVKAKVVKVAGAADTQQRRKAEQVLKSASASDAPSVTVEDLTALSYDDQILLFNAIKNVFALASNEEFISQYDSEDDFFVEKMEEVLTLAVESNVAAQDYLCYLYKRGRQDVFDVDLIRAHQWGLLATAAGSKLSTDRLRLFFSPVYEYVENSGRADDVIDINELDDETVLPFIASIMANIVIEEMGINLLSMSRMSMFPENNENVEEFMRRIEAVRNKNFDKMMSYLTMER